MAVVNNLNTDFLITTKMNPSANITLQSATVYIDGPQNIPEPRPLRVGDP